MNPKLRCSISFTVESKASEGNERGQGGFEANKPVTPYSSSMFSICRWKNSRLLLATNNTNIIITIPNDGNNPMPSSSQSSSVRFAFKLGLRAHRRHTIHHQCGDSSCPRLILIHPPLFIPQPFPVL
jgi:hypothetical protein